MTYWSERERWERKFKLALAANPENFDAEWQDAVDYLNGITDIEEMAKKMTEAAKKAVE